MLLCTTKARIAHFGRGRGRECRRTQKGGMRWDQHRWAAEVSRGHMPHLSLGHRYKWSPCSTSRLTKVILPVYLRVSSCLHAGCGWSDGLGHPSRRRFCSYQHFARDCTPLLFLFGVIVATVARPTLAVVRVQLLSQKRSCLSMALSVLWADMTIGTRRRTRMPKSTTKESLKVISLTWQSF